MESDTTDWFNDSEAPENEQYEEGEAEEGTHNTGIVDIDDLSAASEDEAACLSLKSYLMVFYPQFYN